MKRQALIVLAICVCIGCGKPQTPTGRLTIEAAVIYSLGGPQPVARETFYLLRRDPTEIVREAGTQGQDAEELFGNFFLVRSYMSFENDDIGKNKFNERIKQATAFSATTDFAGKTEFVNLPVGEQFHLFAITETRSGHCVWNQKLEIRPGLTHLMLDQKNAIYSR